MAGRAGACGALQINRVAALPLSQTETQGTHMVIRRIAELCEGRLTRLGLDLKVPIESRRRFPLTGEYPGAYG
jgi:hypothetical protein